MIVPLWAKLERDGQGLPKAWLSLMAHSADVAAVFEAILRVPVVSHRLAALAGQTEVPEVWRARLCTHVALHDFGKANRGFQERWFANAKMIGHIAPAVALMCADDELRDALFDVLPFAEMEEWGAFNDAFLSIIAHHGRPVNCEKALGDWKAMHRDLWCPIRNDGPVAALRPLGEAVRTWFPVAFTTGGVPLSKSPPFWHAIAGLTMLADWIGSDTSSFPVNRAHDVDDITWARQRAPQVLIDYGFDPAPHRQGLVTPMTFDAISPYPPHALQRAAGEADGQIVVLEAETGSGKTEAALYRFARLFAEWKVDGLYFALPTRVAAKSLYNRVEAAVARLFPESLRPTVILAVPGYAKADGIGMHMLPDFKVQWDDAMGDNGPSESELRSRWAAEHPKRFLAGMIAVGTIDQALLGTIQVKHAHMRSASLLRHLLVVDEVHASDTYMEQLLCTLLTQHKRAGGHALLLSATLGSAARTRLLGLPNSKRPGVAAAVALDYPALSTSNDPLPGQFAGSKRTKTVSVVLDPRIASPDDIARIAIDAAGEGAKVLVVRNTQREAVATAEALLALAPDHPAMFRCKGVPTLHHGRFAREDRELLDAEIECRIGRERPPGSLILIGTQTLEQSLDIDADLIITDLSPADVLLQRLGRLHRHERDHRPSRYSTPQAIVLCPDELAPLLGRGRHGLGGEYGPYRDLVGLEATRRLIVNNPHWLIPAMNRMLVEYATHPDALEELTCELEAVVPRWREARQKIEGVEIGNKQVATDGQMKWSKPMWDAASIFPQGEKIGTRLGAQDLAVVLPDGLSGPFGTPVKLVSIPSYWLGKVDLMGDVELKAPVVTAGGFEFRIQTSAFSYDRFGLSRIST